MAAKIKKESVNLTPVQITAPATIEALILSLSSQHKRSNRYFDGELTDGEGIIRFVGFDTNQAKTLETYYDKGTPVTLIGCKIQHNKKNTKNLVVVKTYTKIWPSSLNSA